MGEVIETCDQAYDFTPWQAARIAYNVRLGAFSRR